MDSPDIPLGRSDGQRRETAFSYRAHESYMTGDLNGKRRTRARHIYRAVSCGLTSVTDSQDISMATDIALAEI